VIELTPDNAERIGAALTAERDRIAAELATMTAETAQAVKALRVAALRRLEHATGEPVTTRELADELGLASNSVAHRYLTRLCHEGLARQMRRAGEVRAPRPAAVSSGGEWRR
jgi:response regulator of citrate/malate metabolism